MAERKGKGKDSGQRGGSGDGKAATERYIRGAKIRELHDRRKGRWQRTVKRVLDARDLRRGRLGVVLPDKGEYTDEELARTIAVKHPLRKTLLMRMRAVLGEQVARIVREPLGQSLQAKKAATDFESWANAVVDELIDNAVLMGKGLEDASYTVVFLPGPAGWRDVPDYVTALQDDAKGDKKADPRWDRDAAGRSPSESGYTKRSEKASRTAYGRALDDYRARRLPFRVEVLSPTQAYPVLQAGTARDRFETIGLVSRSLFEREELIRMGYRWSRMDDAALLPTADDSDSPYGQGGEVYLYRYIGKTADDHVYVSYSVGGMDTVKANGKDEEEAVIDLTDEYGFTRLPALWIPAALVDDDDYDQMTIPLLNPVQEALVNVETILTHQVIYDRRTAYPGFGVEINDTLPPSTYLDADNNLKPIEIPSEGGAVYLAGRIAPLVAPRTAESVRYVTEHLLGEIQQGTPNVPGEAAAASGHQDVIQKSYFDVAQAGPRNAAARARVFVAECAAELACSAARGRWRVLDGKKVEFPVYVNVPIQPGGDTDAADGGNERQLVTFRERWVGPDLYDLKAEYPKVGNLAEVQQTADLADRGYATFDDVMEARGKEAPEVERARIDADRILKTEEGQLLLLQFAMNQNGDLERAEELRLQLDGRLSKGGPPGDPNAAPLPTAALARPQGPPGAPQGPMPGVQMPNMAASQLGGIVGGAIGAGAQMNDAMTQSQIVPGGGGGMPVPNGVGV